MELKSPKTKKQSNISKLISWGKMFKTPLLVLFLLGTTNCENDPVDNALTVKMSNLELPKSNSELFNLEMHPRIRHPRGNGSVLNDIKYLRRHLNKGSVNFVMTDVLIDGEMEKRVHFNGITAKETYVLGDGNGLKLRQMTDGRRLIQVIYSQSDNIVDCEYTSEPNSVKKFLRTLRKELKSALDEETFRLTQKQSHNVEEEKFYLNYQNVTFRILKSGEKLPRYINNWFPYSLVMYRCLERHEELKYMQEHDKLGAKTRPKRGAMEILRVPGTKWCGKGYSATKYSQLGGYTRTDRCCRVHDMRCPFWIGGMEKKYGLFNWRINTLMHCRCDERFRSCLKLAGTAVANIVGNIFFNVIQTKCFVLKTVKTCTKRSWWGKCLRRGYAKQAYERDNLSY